MKTKIAFGIALTALLIFVGCGGKKTDEAQTQTQAQEQVPAADKGTIPVFTMENVDGTTFNLADHKGKVMIIDLWATWCSPCKKELPSFINLVKKYEGKDFIMIGVSVDEGLSASAVGTFCKGMNVNYPILYAGGPQKAAAIFGQFSAIPTTFIVDKKGVIREKIIGAQEEAVFDNWIAKLLAE